MSPLLFLLCACLATLAATRTAPQVYLREHAEMHFEWFIQKHNKQYLDEAERQARFKIFMENLERVNALNQESDHAVFGVTRFSDLTREEFLHHFTGLGDPGHANLTRAPCNDVYDSQIVGKDAPESFDWREHNAVTRIKNQGQCGSCYSFSASGNIEGLYAIKHGKLIELSDQQSVDCDKSSNGCYGGAMTTAFRSMIQQGGIATEADYPYVGRKQQCKFTPNKAAVKLSDCNLFKLNSQEKLKQLLYKNGPISIGVQSENFQAYHGGIMSDKVCNVGNVNHAVLLVGYGTENGRQFWTFKNSWGESFGERGYIRVERGEQASSCKMMNNGFMSSAVVV